MFSFVADAVGSLRPNGGSVLGGHRRVAAIGVTTALAIGGGSLGVPAADARQRCVPGGAKTVLRTQSAGVYSVRGRGGVVRKFVGCLRGRTKPLPLANDRRDFNPDSGQTNADFRLAGHWVAWTQAYWSDEGTGWSGELIELRDLRRKGRAIELNARGSVKRVLPRPDGAVAWLLSFNDYLELDKVDSGVRTPEPLTYSRDIDPASVRVDGGGVSWTQGGVERRVPWR